MINWTRGGLKGNNPEHKQLASDPCRAGFFDETALLSDFYRSCMKKVWILTSMLLRSQLIWIYIVFKDE